jgi:hypothetical protein
MSGSPREYACPSDAEEHAALYNMACCYAQLGQKAAALTCLESILETGAECGGGAQNMLTVADETEGAGIYTAAARRLLLVWQWCFTFAGFSTHLNLVAACNGCSVTEVADIVVRCCCCCCCRLQ